MTVVVGFVGTDGAVMAADSEATEGPDGHTRYDVEKIWTCGGLLMGYTGTSSVKQPLEQSLGQIILAQLPGAEVDRNEALNVCRRVTAQVLSSVYQFHVGARDDNNVPNALKGLLLVIGRDADGYWMLEIDYMASCTFDTDQSFHTVGSGAAAAYVAHSLMKEYHSAGRSCADLKLIAHRTVQNCIDTMGGPMGVGGYVKLWYSEANSPFAKATQLEIETIEDGVAQWRGIERESLNLARGGAPQPDDVPLPELPPSPTAPAAPEVDPGAPDADLTGADTPTGASPSV
jgi:20S proteasome alpha/beta subunit